MFMSKLTFKQFLAIILLFIKTSKWTWIALSALVVLSIFIKK